MVLKFINWVNNQRSINLVRIAALGGMATICMGLLTKFKISDNIKQTDYCKEALATLRKHKGALSLLGHPIKDLTVNVENHSKNFTKGDVAQYEIPVCGSKQKGTLYFWAERQQSQWVVTRIELELKNDPYKRLLIQGSHDK